MNKDDECDQLRLERDYLRLELERMKALSRRRYLLAKFRSHMVLAVFGAAVVAIKTRRQPFNSYPYEALVRKYRSEL